MRRADIEHLGAPDRPADHHIAFGRSFSVLARFSGQDYVERANAFMEATPGSGLLAEVDGQAIIASKADKGVPVVRCADAGSPAC
jgi:hypothetical protein